MHEVSLCQSIIKQLQAAAEKENFTAVKTIWLELGVLPHVTEEALQFAFRAVAKATIAEDAQLTILSIPGKGQCGACGTQAVISERFDPCPICGQSPIALVEGDEMRIKDIEVV